MSENGIDSQGVLPSPDLQTPAPIGAGAAVAGTFTQPGETFARLVKAPTWWLPFVLWIVAIAVTIFVATSKIDMEGTVREAIEKRAAKSGQTVPEEVVQRQVQAAEKFSGIGLPIGVATTAALFFLVAAILLGGGRAFGGEMTYKQTLSVWGHANLVNVVGALISIPVLLPMDDGSMTQTALQQAVKSNVGAFLPEGTPAAVLAIATSLDVFSLATLALLVVGFRKLPGLSSGNATAVPVGLWVVYVLLKAGWAALFG